MPPMVTLSRVMMLFAKNMKKRTTGTSRKIAITRNRVIIHFLSPRHWPGQTELADRTQALSVHARMRWETENA